MRFFVRPFLVSLLLLAALGLLAAGPLPEILIGELGWQDNWARESQGRAHERSILHQRAAEEAEELQARLDARRREAGELSTVSELRRYLQRYGEADLGLRLFLLWYNSLPAVESEGVIDPQLLLNLVYSGRVTRIRLAWDDSEETDPAPGERPIRLRMLDDKGRLVHEGRFVTSRLKGGLRDLEWIDSSYEPAHMDSSVLGLEPDRWVENRDLLPFEYHDRLTRLLLDPELRIHTLYRTPEGELFLEAVEDSLYTLYRMPAGGEDEPWRFPWFGG